VKLVEKKTLERFEGKAKRVLITANSNILPQSHGDDEKPASLKILMKI
jgi:hypothetical protein